MGAGRRRPASGSSATHVDVRGVRFAVQRGAYSSRFGECAKGRPEYAIQQTTCARSGSDAFAARQPASRNGGRASAMLETAPNSEKRRLGARTRKAVLVVHIASAGAWLGIDVVMAVLIFTALGSDDGHTRGCPRSGTDAHGPAVALRLWPHHPVGAPRRRRSRRHRRSRRGVVAHAGRRTWRE